MTKKSLLCELRKHFKLFPKESEVYNLKLYFPDYLSDEPYLEVEIQRLPKARWERFHFPFSVTSGRKIERENGK